MPDAKKVDRMSSADRPLDDILRALRERAKELNCLYRVDAILNRSDLNLLEAIQELVQVIPAGWQYPDHCTARVVLEGRAFRPAGFRETPWHQTAPIISEGQTLGEVAVYYTEPKPALDEGPFLREERRLINAIAERIGYRLMQRRLRTAIAAARQDTAGNGGKWNVILHFLRGADPALLRRITRRMINYLCWNGVEGAQDLLRQAAPDASGGGEAQDNRPERRAQLGDVDALAERTFQIAATHLLEDEVVRCIQTWIQEDKVKFLYSIAERLDAPLTDLASALERFASMHIDEDELPQAVRRGVRVALLRRLFTDQLEFIEQAKKVARIADFHDLSQHMVLTSDSHGRLGGKSAGLFLASRIVRDSVESQPMLGDLRVPRTWHVPSDALLEFLRYNDMEDIFDRKYREIDLIRQDYPYLVQAFKAAPFPPELSRGLAAALDDFEGRPIIVRSSSLLEDRVGSAFSGKYKSLFLANQGGKRERLEALKDAVAEVYASVFGPDPIGYRIERGLLDVHEEMGIMIQEVVGTRVGRYFLPAFSGVAYSHNEFRWSSRIRREDGLLRLVPGLGTRAVDRLSDDYPVLIAPGQPGLRVNTTPEEIVRYSPRKIDVIDVDTNTFATLELRDLLRRHGEEYPLVRRLVVEIDNGHVRRPGGLPLDFERGKFVATFEGLVSETAFVTQIRALLTLLQERLGVPVDIEFASDGQQLYLLQCRAQGYGTESAPTPIPRDLPRERMLFSAKRFVSNGRVPEITHIVYVDEEAYHALPDARSMREVGTAIGRLNQALPRRQFVLMGPGRWGSRGDIRLGVSVTYSQINNTAVLIEIARRKGDYLPDLSFGTHFFQDLVEASIRYLPLYPGEEGVVFNEPFFRRSRNILADLLPEVAGLAPTLRVIDVPAETGGKVLQILMNADLDEAVGLLATPATESGAEAATRAVPAEVSSGDHWRWRMRMAERIAASIDPGRFGVKALYVIGSAKNATAGPGSDLDLIVHVDGSDAQRTELLAWLQGWSLCLAEMNYLRSGYPSDGLLDVHLITDADVARQTSFAAKINAVTDPARRLPLGGNPDREPSPR
jgi:hypothetical protein